MAMNFLRCSVIFACSYFRLRDPVCMAVMLAVIMELVSSVIGPQWSRGCLAVSLSVGDCWLPGAVLRRDYMLLLSTAQHKPLENTG